MKTKQLFQKKYLQVIVIAFFISLNGTGCVRHKDDVSVAISEYAKNHAEAKITIGILDNDKIEYSVYGENGEKLSSQEYTYAIGSITKTFTGSLIAKGINENKLNLNERIDTYLTMNPMT